MVPLVEVSQELKQTLIHCQGDMHLAVAKWKIEKQHKLEVRFVKPKIAFVGSPRELDKFWIAKNER